MFSEKDILEMFGALFTQGEMRGMVLPTTIIQSIVRNWKMQKGLENVALNETVLVNLGNLVIVQKELARKMPMMEFSLSNCRVLCNGKEIDAGKVYIRFRQGSITEIDSEYIPKKG